MRDLLWSPWRFEYVTGTKPETCPFCDAPGHEPADSLVVHRGRTAYIVLNRYPYNPGHLLVAPYRHHPTLSGLASAELSELAFLCERSETALREAYGPDGINVGINLGRPAGAGIVEHLHVHLVPRWSGDTNFMTVVGETRVLAESLASTAARLRPVFERLHHGLLK